MGRSRPEPRLPFDPVWREVGATDQGDAARKLGLSRRTVHRYVKGGVPVGASDALATSIGLHPLFLWGDDWSHACDQEAAYLLLADAIRRARRYDRERLFAGLPNTHWDDHGWSEWSNQRDRLAREAADTREERNAADH